MVKKAQKLPKVNKNKKKSTKKKPKVTRKTKKKIKRKRPSSPSIPRRSGLISTGSSGLNKLIGGGIKPGSAILIHGTPHCGKKPLLMKLGYTNLAKKKPVIFVLTDFGVSSWDMMMKGSRWNLKKYWDNVYFVDLYSSQFAACPIGANIICVPVPYSLGRLSIEVSNFLDQIAENTDTKPIVIFHSLSTLLQNYEESDVFKFMQFFVGKLRAKGVTSVFSLQSGIHVDHIENLHRGLMDGVIEMTDGKLRAIGFGRIGATPWAKCVVKGSDIIVTPIKEKKE